MKIQKYAALKMGSAIPVVGYICEIRQEISEGKYSQFTDYLMSVNVKSMPNNPEHWGSWLVEKNSIVPYN
jgi:hypothetical protein